MNSSWDKYRVREVELGFIVLKPGLSDEPVSTVVGYRTGGEAKEPTTLPLLWPDWQTASDFAAALNLGKASR